MSLARLDALFPSQRDRRPLIASVVSEDFPADFATSLRLSSDDHDDDEAAARAYGEESAGSGSGSGSVGDKNLAYSGSTSVGDATSAAKSAFSSRQRRSRVGAVDTGRGSGPSDGNISTNVTDAAAAKRAAMTANRHLNPVVSSICVPDLIAPFSDGSSTATREFSFAAFPDLTSGHRRLETGTGGTPDDADLGSNHIYSEIIDDTLAKAQANSHFERSTRNQNDNDNANNNNDDNPRSSRRNSKTSTSTTIAAEIRSLETIEDEEETDAFASFLSPRIKQQQQQQKQQQLQRSSRNEERSHADSREEAEPRGGRGSFRPSARTKGSMGTKESKGVKSSSSRSSVSPSPFDDEPSPPLPPPRRSPPRRLTSPSPAAASVAATAAAAVAASAAGAINLLPRGQRCVTSPSRLPRRTDHSTPIASDSRRLSEGSPQSSSRLYDHLRESNSRPANWPPAASAASSPDAELGLSGSSGSPYHRTETVACSSDPRSSKFSSATSSPRREERFGNGEREKNREISRAVGFPTNAEEGNTTKTTTKTTKTIGKKSFIFSKFEKILQLNDWKPLEIDVVQTLEEFWTLKRLHEACPSTPAKNGFPEVRYVFEDDDDDDFDDDIVCFALLPGGSCFASPPGCRSKLESRNAAAKTALVNSVFNEHPSRIINDVFIENSLNEAIFERPTNREGADDVGGGLAVFRLMLHQNKGRTLMEFQELMSLFQLLHWNGSLKAMRERNCTRGEVLQHYSSTGFSNEAVIREEMALDWATREAAEPGTLRRESAKVTGELNRLRARERELRFAYEKFRVLKAAAEHFRRREGMTL